VCVRRGKAMLSRQPGEPQGRFSALIAWEFVMSTTSLTLSGKLHRDAGIVGLLFASTTSMVGSGWLFGSYHAAKIAGPLSIGSWVLGAIIIMLIALCFAELAALFPRSGALVHMSHASHGEGLGRIWCWLLFLA
jgi:amino acid transporter